ncbi:diguanylate cyclase [Alkaliphilus oremlandii]|uniref:Diguanylate cyclase n=1 Tax=Alkaliphilus oremlandii (strain OhILAs) TaxID=350688 RepID=A8MF63_ALKOO|nr:diguanylate cyclase [Alkaliphilus oremlandii]ABW18732.1 diguanylate cyclase [Alkaliphilus oremlandii OhILAs]
MELINSRYKILNCIEQDHYYSQYVVLDLMKKGEKFILNLVQNTQDAKPFIEYCSNNFYEISSYSQESILNIYSYGIVETIDDKLIEEMIFFYTTEYVEGMSLLDLKEPLDQLALYEVYKQLSRALDYLHFHGIVYKYIGVETVKIIKKDDRVMVKLADIISTHRMEVFNNYLHPLTRIFLSPETWSYPINSSSDIYSLGSLMYYLLTLSYPNGKDLEQHLKNMEGHSIERKLLMMIQNMTRKEAHNRYRTLHECNEDIVKIYGTNEVIENLKDIDKINFQTSIIGRDHEIKQVLEICDVGRGKLNKFTKNLVLVNGDKGIGKTRFLKEISHLMKWKKYKTFHIDIHSNQYSSRDIISAIVKQYIKISPEEYIEKYGLELVKLVPELGVTRKIIPSSALPSEQEKLRLYDRTANFILDVSIAHPSAILLDNFDSSDGFIVEFVDYLLNLNKVKNAPILLVLAYREDNFDFIEYADYIYRWNLNNALNIKLSRLTIEETSKMVKHILGWHKEPLRFATRLMKDTEGNPSYIEEVMKELYTQQIITFNYSTQYRGFAPHIAIDDYNEIVISKNVDESIVKQLQSLDKKLREILEIVSLFNTSISRDIIISMIGSENEDFEHILLQLTQLKILNEKFDDWGYTYGFYNQDFKKQIYRSIEEHRRNDLHIKASIVLEELYMKEDRENKDELIFHLIQSGQNDRSIDYCIESGIGMLKIFAYEQAYTIFMQALELLEDDRDPRKLSVLLHLGEINQKLIKNKESISYLSNAMKLAKIQHKMEEYIDAKTSIGLIYSIRNEFQSAQTYFMESIEEATEIQYFDGVMKAAYSLGRVYMSTRDLEKMKCIIDQYYNYALDQKNIYYMGMFIGLKGIVEYFQENIETALSYFERAVEYLESVNKIEETARPINNIGVIYNDHFQDTHTAREYYQRALTISEQYRIADGIITFSNNLAESYRLEHNYQEAIDVLINTSLGMALEYEDEMSTILVYISLITSYTSVGEYREAYEYLLKAEKLLKNNKCKTHQLYFENFLEVAIELYIALGDYEEAFRIIDQFHREFPYAEASMRLRVRKLQYFAKHQSSKDVTPGELLELVAEYRYTSYIRDRRTILLEAAEHFARQSMFEECKELLDEDHGLSSLVDNRYYTLIRNYVESFLLNNEEQISALENLLLHYANEGDEFNEVKWKINMKLGILYIQSKAYYRSISRFLTALDLIYKLYMKVPVEYRKSYLMKDDKFLVKVFLSKMEKLIHTEVVALTEKSDRICCEKYKAWFCSEERLDEFFDVVGLQKIINSRNFYDIAVEYYDTLTENTIKSVEQLIASLTEDNVYNLNIFLKFVGRVTLASKGAIIDDHGYKIITSFGENIPKEKLNSILESIPNINKEVFIKNDYSQNTEFNRDYFENDIRSIICLPIYKDIGVNDESDIFENDRRTNRITQNKIIGYLYLDNDKALGNFTNESLMFCKNILPLAGILLTNRNLAMISNIDRMTGAYTRKYFEQIFDEEIEQAKESNQPLSIIMLDIDHFKNVNDIYGHQKGDNILTEVGRIIKSNIRSTDHVGRYGGEEFVIILPNTSNMDAFHVAEKIRLKVQSTNLLGKAEVLTISCGISTFPIDSNKQLQIIEKADQALYHAKENGRNRSVRWDKEIILSSKRVDKLAGIVTGNNVQDQRNVLAITEIINLIGSSKTVDEKIFTAIGRLIEILEAEEGMIVTVKNNKIDKKYYRRQFIEDWASPFVFNEFLIRRCILSMEGRYIIDWDNISDVDPLTNTPNWKSVIVIPVVVNQEVCGVIYLAVPIKEKEFDYAEYNLVEVTSHVVGAILKISEPSVL